MTCWIISVAHTRCFPIRRNYKQIVESQTRTAGGSGAGLLLEWDTLINQMYHCRGQIGIGRIVTVVFKGVWSDLVPSPLDQDTVISIDLSTWADDLPDDYQQRLNEPPPVQEVQWVGLRQLWRWLEGSAKFDAPPLGPKILAAG